MHSTPHCHQSLTKLHSSFSISAYGGPGGPVGQLGDGQNRIGQTGLPTGHYNVDEQGGVWDDQGRGCECASFLQHSEAMADIALHQASSPHRRHNGSVTSAQLQHLVSQLDATAPSRMFGLEMIRHSAYADFCSVDRHDGESTFYACFTSDQGAWNIYSQPIPNEPTCTPIWMLADSCHDECVVTSTVTAPCTTSSTWGVGSPVSTWAGPPPVSAHAPPPVSTYAPPPAPKPACPAELPYNFEAPHLIIPVDAKHRDTKYGTSYNGTASGTVTSICEFRFPHHSHYCTDQAFQSISTCHPTLRTRLATSSSCCRNNTNLRPLPTSSKARRSSRSTTSAASQPRRPPSPTFLHQRTTSALSSWSLAA